MAPIIPGLDGIDWAATLGRTIYWLGITIGSCILAGGSYALYYMNSFNYKVKVFPLYGGVEDQTFSIGKAKNNRVKWNKEKTAWKKLFPLMNKDQIEPFKNNYIYAGKQIYAFELGKQWVPASLEITRKEKGNLLAKINPAPHHIRAWQSLMHKKNAEEFATHNFWDDNKSIIMVIGVALFCCILVGVTVYFTYQFTTGQMAGSVSSMNNLADAMRNFGGIGGGPG